MGLFIVFMTQAIHNASISSVVTNKMKKLQLNNNRKKLLINKFKPMILN